MADDFIDYVTGDTTALRTRMLPTMRRLEPHSGLQPGPSMDKVLHDLITGALVYMVDDLAAYRDSCIAASKAGPEAELTNPLDDENRVLTLDELAALDEDGWHAALGKLDHTRAAELLGLRECERKLAANRVRALADVAAQGAFEKLEEVEQNEDLNPGDVYEGSDGRTMRMVKLSKTEGKMLVTALSEEEIAQSRIDGQ